jgi:hypothetical protein
MGIVFSVNDRVEQAWGLKGKKPKPFFTLKKEL